MSEIAFPDAGPNLNERLSGCWLEYEGVRAKVRGGGLSYMAQTFVNSIFADPKADESAEERAMRVAPIVALRELWELRLGIDEVQGEVAEWVEVQLGDQCFRALSRDSALRLPAVLREAAIEKIREYTGITEGERDKVVFTLASPAT